MARRLVRELAPPALVKIVRAARLFQRQGVSAPQSWLRGLRLGSPVAAARLGYLPSSCLRKPRTIIDVGAHEGLWSETVLRVLRPVALIAIEPNPTSFAALAQRLRSDQRVVLHQIALGSHAGQAELHITRGSDFSSLLRPRREAAAVYGQTLTVEDKVRVDVARLDDIAADIDEVSLLKIDVQGGEKAVLEGGEETLGRTKNLLIEVVFAPHYEGELSFREVDDALADRGFSLYASRPRFTRRTVARCGQMPSTRPMISRAERNKPSDKRRPGRAFAQSRRFKSFLRLRTRLPAYSY